MVEQQIIRESPEYIKLIKNTKGYNWEIKVNSLDVKKLEEVNLEVQKTFSDGMPTLD